MRQNKIIKLTFSIFLSVGLLFLILGITLFAVLNQGYTENTQGVITKIDHRNEKTLVSYTVDGLRYESSLNVYSSNFQQGDKISIYYNADNPEKITVKSLNYIFLIIPFLGLMFAVIGGIGLFIIVKSKHTNEKLVQNGRLIYADITDIRLNTSIRVNGIHPYNIICQWTNPEDNRTYIFKSENLWTLPKEIAEQHQATAIPVYINTENIKEYYVDTEKLTSNVVDLT